jgi:hypothetical protein
MIKKSGMEIQVVWVWQNHAIAMRVHENKNRLCVYYFFLSFATTAHPVEPDLHFIQSPSADRGKAKQWFISLTVDLKKASLCL